MTFFDMRGEWVAIWLGRARQGKARLGMARQGKHTASFSEEAEVWRGTARQGLAGRGAAWLCGMSAEQ